MQVKVIGSISVIMHYEDTNMATIWEETKSQGAKMKGRPIKEKLEYFWEYYKIHTLTAAVIITLAVSLIHAWVTAKDPALSVVLINSMTETVEGTMERWNSDLTEKIEFDPKEYEVTIDATVMLGAASATANQEYASSQKLAALIGSASVDVMIADSSVFEQYSQNEVLCDLRELYSQDELGSLEGRIYYTDASTYSDYDSPDLEVTEKQAAYVIDHRDPASMKQPVPVGIYMDEDTLIGQSGVYAYLTAADTYQGHPSEAILGIPVNSPRKDAAMAATDYFLNGD